MSTAQKTSFLRQTLGPLFLLIVCPPTAILFWYTNVHLEGSFLNLWNLITAQGLLHTIYQAWSPVFWGSKTAWTILGVFSAIQLAFMKLLPGGVFHGPMTPKGNVPLYKSNGVFAFGATILLFFLCAYQFQLFNPAIVYDQFGYLLGALNLFSLLFCVFLVLKGKYAPSSTDSGATGNWIFDYYWGTELYPRVFGWDIKMFTNCRFGLMSWAIIILCFAAKQKEIYGEISDSMMVAVALQLIYITKFFFWETGYLSSLDIMHDRAGYYICWGCLVWVPGIYTSATLYLVNHPNHLGWPLATLMFVLGAICILVNYWADWQRQHFRTCKGKCKVWGRTPTLIEANYVTDAGERKKSLLLTCGWWGIARHFHYVPEILGALFWSLPALFGNFLPYFYVVYLTVLLTDRAFRDEERCSKKYGEDWQRYCDSVPYKILPGFI